MKLDRKTFKTTKARHDKRSNAEGFMTINVTACLDAYRLGDRLGAPWETGGVDWSPASYETILQRGKGHPWGTDESDTVDCFERFVANHDYQNSEQFLVAWADFHERHRRHTSYGSTWRDYFATVKYLRKKNKLNLDTLYRCASERKPGGSAGNGFFALVLPVYAYALKVGEDPHALVRDVVRLTHAHSNAIGCARFLTHLFDSARGVVDDIVEIETCPAILRYFELVKPSRFDCYGFEKLPPKEFAKRFPSNILCCNTLAHALYAAQSSESEEELVCTVVGLRGDVDSVLALAMMLYRLFAETAKQGIAIKTDETPMEKAIHEKGFRQ